MHAWTGRTLERLEALRERNANSQSYCACNNKGTGWMIECELCKAWYHGQCLKLKKCDVDEGDRCVHQMIFGDARDPTHHTRMAGCYAPAACGHGGFR